MLERVVAAVQHHASYGHMRRRVDESGYPQSGHCSRPPCTGLQRAEHTLSIFCEWSSLVRALDRLSPSSAASRALIKHSDQPPSLARAPYPDRPRAQTVRARPVLPPLSLSTFRISRMLPSTTAPTLPTTDANLPLPRIARPTIVALISGAYQHREAAICLFLLQPAPRRFSATRATP